MASFWSAKKQVLLNASESRGFSGGAGDVGFRRGLLLCDSWIYRRHFTDQSITLSMSTVHVISFCTVISNKI